MALAAAGVLIAGLAACTGGSSDKSSSADCGTAPVKGYRVNRGAAPDPVAVSPADAQLSVLTGLGAGNSASDALPASDGSDLYVRDQDRVALVGPDRSTIWARSASGMTGAWSASGRQLLVVTSKGVAVLDGATGSPIGCLPGTAVSVEGGSQAGVASITSPNHGPLLPQYGSIEVGSDQIVGVQALNLAGNSSDNATGVLQEHLPAPDYTVDTPLDWFTMSVAWGEWQIVGAQTSSSDAWVVLGGGSPVDGVVTQLAFVGDPPRSATPAGTPRAQPNGIVGGDLSIRDYTGPVAGSAPGITAPWQGLAVLGTGNGVTLVRDVYAANLGRLQFGGLAALDRQGSVLWTQPAVDGTVAAIGDGQVLIGQPSDGGLGLTLHDAVTGATTATWSVQQASLTAAGPFQVVAVGDAAWLISDGAAVWVPLVAVGDADSPITFSAPLGRTFVGVNVDGTGRAVLVAGNASGVGEREYLRVG